jgi:hypothetical protein
MAHIAKYKATSVGHMLAHYRRDESSLGRDNIDPKRVKNDMVVAHYTNKDGKLVVGRVVPREGEPNWGTVERRIERVNEAQKAAGKRATRKDAVVMADVVVTLPDNVRKGDEDRFFRLTYWYLSNKFGIDNMMGGFVHKDEVLKDGTPARDHMHVPFTPILDGRFNYKKMCPRSFYQTMHGELGDYLEKRMGYRPEVELGDETRAMRVYTDKSADIAKVRGAVERGIVEPAERQVAQAVEDAAQRVEDAAQMVEEARAELDELRGAVSAEQARLESLRQGTRAIERDVAELRPIAAEIGRWEAADRAGKRAILDSIAARCAGAARAARAAIEELGDRIRALMRPRKAQRTVGDVMREAADVARAEKALSRNHVAPTNSRQRGQAR